MSCITRSVSLGVIFFFFFFFAVGTVVLAGQGDYADENIDTVPNAETRQEITVFIFGPTFVPGEAQASASLSCGLGLLFSGIDLGRTIKIVEE